MKRLIKDKPLVKGAIQTRPAKVSAMNKPSTKQSLYRKVREDMDKKFKKGKKK